MVQTDDNLFRQFRLPWVPAWVPDWIEAPLRSSRIWSVLALVVVTAALSYAGWRALQAQTGQADIDLATWEQRLKAAEPRQRPELLESLFQLPNDGALALGLAYLNSVDASERRVAGLALRDAADQWNQWPVPAATAQYERAVRLLAEIVSELHAPEQSLAVELARQAMIRPGSADPSLRDSLRAQALTVMSRANSAHSAGLIAADDRNLLDGDIDPWRNSAAAPSRTGSTESAPRLAPGDQPRDNPRARSAELPADRESNTDGRVAESTTGSAANRFLPAGFARPTRDTNPPPNSGDWANPATPPSQVPLFDERGRRIEVRTLDPAQLTVPGGLIPVEMSGFAPTPARSSSNPGSTESSLRRPTDPENTAAASDRIGTARLPEAAPNGSASAAGPVVPLDTLRRELAAALERREQDLVAAQREDRSPRFRPTTPQQTQETEIITSRPALPPTPPTRVADLLPANDNERDLQAPPSTDGIPGRTVAAPRNASPRPRLPSNPYRSSARANGEPNPLSEDVARSATSPAPNRASAMPTLSDSGPSSLVPSGDGERPGSPSRRQVPRPSSALSRLSHIEVMQLLRSPDPNRVNQAVQELGQRGFNADYVAVARRLTSPDANERYQLVFDLLSSTRVDPNPFLRWLATDPDPEVQSLAIEALEMLNASGKNRAVDVTVTPSLRR